MALTLAEIHLVHGFKLFGMTETEVIGAMLALRTPEQQDEMLRWMTENPKATPSDLLGTIMDITAGKR